MNLPDPLYLTRGKTTKKYIEKNLPQLYEFFINNYPEDLSFDECVYWYKHNILEYVRCPICGNRVKFINSTKGYYKYCSSKCVNNSPEVKSKKLQTSIDKYGSIEESYLSRQQKTKETLISKYGSIEKSYQDRLEKTKQTNLERYGYESNMGTPEFIKKTKETLISKYGSIEKSYQDRLEKTKQTNLERYGTNYYMNTSEFYEKTKQTNLERYGVENVMQNETIQNKVKQTNLERYGVECSFNNKDCRERAKSTMIDKYGVEYAQQCKKTVEKSKNTRKNRIIDTHDDILEIVYNEELSYYICKCPHKTCNKCIDKTYRCTPVCYYNRRYKNIELCTNLLSEQISHSKNTYIEIFITNILDKYNIEYVKNVRDVIDGELDIFIPLKNVAIECNGCYWHSDINKDNSYHINKYKKCLEKNIQLLSIWEDQIINTPDIIESLILSKLGLCKKIYARKCELKEVTSKESKQFLTTNHLQGNVNSSIRIGLYYNDELVSLMTFGKNRKSLNSNSSKDSYELYRFCNKKNVQVIGGASKILNHFIKKYQPSKIISFASNDISNGSLYYKLGFNKVGETISYWYIDPKTMSRHHRYKFRKSELIKMGYDKNMSEKDIMDALKYLRIYDTGQSKFELIF